MSAPEWMEAAACRGMDTNMFFPERGEPVDNARAVCARCPVNAECLEYALANRDKFGVWGGKSERERRKLRSARYHEKGAA